MQVFSAWCLGYRQGAAKLRPWGRKMPRVGSPGSTKGAKGSPNASKNAPKNHRKSAPLSRTASKGAFRVPWVPQRLQNTSISDVPPTDVTPRRGNVHLLSAIPHSLAPSHCEASLKRGGLGICPLGFIILYKIICFIRQLTRKPTMQSKMNIKNIASG